MSGAFGVRRTPRYKNANLQARFLPHNRVPFTATTATKPGLMRQFALESDANFVR
jgi:hypothetical protein